MGTTTIEVTDEQHTELNERKQHRNEPIKDVVGRLLGGDGDTEPTATVTPEVDTDALAEVEDNVQEALADAGAGLTYDDVKQACQAALRDELPVEEMGR